MSSKEEGDIVICPFCRHEEVRVLGSTLMGSKVYRCGYCDKVFLVLKVKSYTINVEADKI